MRAEGVKLVFIESVCNPKHQTHMTQLSTAAVWLNGRQYLCLPVEMLTILFFLSLITCIYEAFHSLC